MNREELEKLIDNEVLSLFNSMNMREPQEEPVQIQQQQQQQQNQIIQQPIMNRANLSSEELDEILFYGGEKPKK